MSTKEMGIVKSEKSKGLTLEKMMVMMMSAYMQHLYHEPVLPQWVKKFPMLYENRRLITVFKTAHH